MRKYLSTLAIILVFINSCKSQNKQMKLDSSRAAVQMRAAMAHQDSLNKKIGYKPESVILTDGTSCFNYLSGKHFSSGNITALEFDAGGHTATISGYILYGGGYYNGKVSVDINLGGINYASVKFKTVAPSVYTESSFPYCNLAKNGVLFDGQNIKMDEDWLKRKVGRTGSANNPAASVATKIDTLTLTGGQISMGAGSYLYFSSADKKDIVAWRFDSCYTGQGHEYLWTADNAGPAIQVKPQFLNKKYAVTYSPDSIPQNDTTVIGLKIDKMVLIKPKPVQNNVKDFMNKLNSYKKSN